VTKKRKKYSQQFKFKVALEAIKELKTINEIASVYNVHPTQVKSWKKQLLAEGPTVFGQNLAQQLREQEARETELYEQIGRLKMELEVAEPDPAAVAAMQEMLHNVPDGYGVITADDFNLALLENPDLIVIDVRTQGELDEKGVIEAENWTHVPLEEFVAMKDQWPADMDASIVVYCGSGHRSTIAMSILWAYGYSDVRSLKGGFGGWVEAGYPVVEFALP